MADLVCIMCGAAFTGRRDKTLCSPECKRQAKRAYDVARYPSVKDEAVRRAREWQAENRARKRAYDQQYREQNASRLLAAQRERSREYHRLHPELAVYRAHARRSRKAANGVYVVTSRDYNRLLAAYGNCCAYCQGAFDPANPLEWDHVVPISRGGVHSVGNIVPSCRRCNRAKSKRFVSEWRR